MKTTEWYLEYELQYNRPGLLGDISSLLGMLAINIITINGVGKAKRGMLLTAKEDKKITRLRTILETMDTIELIKLRKPNLRDKLAVRHGRYIHRDVDDRKTVRFVRDELGLLVDFMRNFIKVMGISLSEYVGCHESGKLNRLSQLAFVRISDGYLCRVPY